MSERIQKVKTGLRFRVSYIIILSMLFLLSGCQKEDDFEETSLRILKKGQIENDIVEAFGEAYYNADELKEMLADSIRAYNEGAAGQDPVALKDVKVEKNTVHVVITYKSYLDYAAFNQVDFFYGKLAEASAAGYDMNVNLNAPLENKKIGLSELNGTENNIVILSEHVLVEPDSDIEYVSANVEYIDERHARVSSDSAGLAYLVLK